MKTLLDREDLVFNPPELGCVLYLPGLPGGGSKIYDRSPYGTPGSITGAAWKRLPSGLWCLNFDGTDDKVTVTSGGLDGITDSFTVKVWFKKDANKGIGAIFIKNSYTFSIVTEAIGGVGTTAHIRCYVGGTNYEDFVVRPLSIVNPTVWLCFGLTYDGTTARVYKNGQAHTANTSAGKSAAATGAMYIGRFEPGGGYEFPGDIAILQIIRGTVWTELDFQNSFNREKHLFGVWSH